VMRDTMNDLQARSLDRPSSRLATSLPMLFGYTRVMIDGLMMMVRDGEVNSLRPTDGRVEH